MMYNSLCLNCNRLTSSYSMNSYNNVFHVSKSVEVTKFLLVSGKQAIIIKPILSLYPSNMLYGTITFRTSKLLPVFISCV